MKTSKVYTYLFASLILMIFSCTLELDQNKLLKAWTGPFMGTPAFNKMRVKDVKPAMLKAMQLNLQEIDAITENPEKPSFENTIEAMERSGKVLDRAFAYYGIFGSNMSSPAFREVQTCLLYTSDAADE